MRNTRVPCSLHKTNGASNHAAEKQNVCGWTGFNILVRDEMEVKKDNTGYLPTIDAPATNMSTVFEVLNQSLKIKDTLKLQALVLVFDQALYTKVAEIKWKHTERFRSIVLRMGAFHTGNNRQEISGCWAKGYLYRIRSYHRGFRVWSVGRPEIQQSCEVPQTEVRSLDASDMDWIWALVRRKPTK